MAVAQTREQRFVLQTDWQGYLKMLEVVGDRKVRVTYSKGMLELMTTSQRHEYINSLLSALVEALVDELGRDFQTGGSPTIKRKHLDCGLEPDDCFWIEQAAAMCQFDWDTDEEVQPPPELAVEVDITRSVISRLGIYAALGVREVWRYKSGRIQVFRLQPGGEYDQVPDSPTFPGFPMSAIREHLVLGRTLPTSQVLRRFRAWVRAWKGDGRH